MDRIETARLVLRGWQPKDLDDLYEYAKSPLVGPPAGWQPHEGREVSAGILRDFIDKQEVWACTLKTSGKPIGSVGLHPDAKRANTNGRMLGYVLGAGHWGRGYATEMARAVLQYAFEVMNLSVVSVAHFPFNKASQNVIQKCGFTYEGTLRHAFTRYDGQLLDEVCYSMLREEYYNNLKENPQ